MKHWKVTPKKIFLSGYDGELESTSNVISIKKDGNEIKFKEECDGYYAIYKSREDAITALKEAIKWLEEEPWTK